MTDRRLNRKLTNEDVTDIKLRLWFCEKQYEVAELYSVSQTTISRILHGQQHYDIRWPDGSAGPLPLGRLREIRSTSPSLALTERKDKPYEIQRPDPLVQRHESAVPEAPGQEHDSSDRDMGGDMVRSEDTGRPQRDLTDAEQFRLNKDTRSKALDDLAAQAEERMHKDLEAAITAGVDSPARVATEIRLSESSKPKYDLMSWDQIEKQSPNLPIVMAGRDSEDIRYCVRAAFKMLPTTLWGSNAAIKLIKDISESLDIDLSKAIKGDD